MGEIFTLKEPSVKNEFVWRGFEKDDWQKIRS
jgi:hypothetical protein